MQTLSIQETPQLVLQPAAPSKLFGLSPDNVTSPVNLTIYLPDCDAAGRAINVAFWIAAMTQLLAHKFGGVSVSPAHKGYWRNSASGDLIKETTFMVSVFVQPFDLERHSEVIEQLILRFGRETGQGEVLVELDDQLLRYTSF